MPSGMRMGKCPGPVHPLMHYSWFFIRTCTKMMISSHLRNDVNAFLHKIEMLSLMPAQQKHLEAPLTQAELEQTIKFMKTGKAPGSDGYIVEWYKSFKDNLLPLVKDVSDEIHSRGSMPSPVYEAAITLILKPGKDP